MPALEGYISAASDVTSCNPAPRTRLRRSPGERVEDRILKVLRAEAESPNSVGLGPKAILARIPKDAEGKRPSLGSIKGTLSRMIHENIVTREYDGYRAVPCSHETVVAARLERELLKDDIPRVHDIQLMFRPQDISKVITKRPELRDIFMRLSTQTDYIARDTPPASKKATKAFIRGYKKGGGVSPPSPTLIAPLPITTGQGESTSSPGLDFINRIFNPLDPYSIIQLFYDPAQAKADEARSHRRYLLDGGFRERYKSPGYTLILHFYWSGVITITLSCSDHPMGAREFHSALCKIDGVLQAKTGISWWDIEPFFFVHMVHIGTDKEPTRELAGVYDLCWTSKDVDGTLDRIYRKLFPDGEVRIRHERCIQNGNIDDHPVSELQRVLESVTVGGVNQSQIQAAAYVNMRETKELQAMVRKMLGKLTGHDQAIAKLIEMRAEDRELISDALAIKRRAAHEDDFYQYIPKSRSNKEKNGGKQ